MTKKERTIKACRELAAKYRDPEERGFFMHITCTLCRIFKVRWLFWRWRYSPNCKGCPLARETGGMGCGSFKTYRAASLSRSRDAFEARAAFFDKIIPILEGIPASRFTKRGWKYFDELDRSW